MLSNHELFATVEATCREQCIIDKFEAENGKITGRMMIDAIDLPDDVSLKPDVNEHIVAFEASFDFTDARIGLALSVTKLDAATSIWISGCDDENAPDNELTEFFVEKLIESIAPDGSYGVPIYVFISDNASFSCVPTAPD